VKSQGKAISASSTHCASATVVGPRDLSSEFINEYDINSPGPFDVIVQKDNVDSDSAIDPLTVGRLIYAACKNNILKLKKIGFSKINIRFKSREATNQLVSNQTLKGGTWFIGPKISKFFFLL